jgi:hypothetical protein
VYIDAGGDTGGDEAPTGELGASGAHQALVSEMRGRIEDLREQLQAERQAHAESRRLLAAALDRIPPQLEAPPDASGSPETATVEEAEPARYRGACTVVA